MSAVIDMAKTRARRARRLPSEHTATTPTPNRAAYYEQQAVEVRAKAELMVNEEIRKAMLRLATVWDAMAGKARIDGYRSSARKTPNALRPWTVLTLGYLPANFDLFPILSFA